MFGHLSDQTHFAKLLISFSNAFGTAHKYVQGNPNQNLTFVLAITLKICISDPRLVNQKCVWEVKVYFEKL